MCSQREGLKAIVTNVNGYKKKIKIPEIDAFFSH
jgi:hypothetical protein